MSTETVDAPQVIKTALAEYQPTAAALAELKHRFGGMAFDLATVKGNQEARAARMELVKLRSSLEAKRKELKAPALERSRLIDDEAKRITGAILELETPIDEQIKADEQRREAERQAKIEAERQRVAALRDRIDAIARIAQRAVGKPATEIESKIKLLVAMTVGDDFGDLKPEAQRVHADTLAQLRELLTAAQAQEAEAARLAAERAELQRQREAQEAEDALVASIQAHAARIEGDGSAYVLKAISHFESGARDFHGDSRPRVVAAIASTRQQLAERLATAQERERIAAEQAAEAQRLAAERAEQARQDALARQERERADREAAEARAEADRQAQAARDAEARRVEAEQAEEARLLAEQRAELQRKQEAQALEAAALAQQRAAAEQADLARQQAEQRAAEEAARKAADQAAATEAAALAEKAQEQAASAAAEAARGPTDAAQELADCRAALADALELLEGWIASKCPKKFVTEHMIKVAELRVLGGLPAVKERAL